MSCNGNNNNTRRRNDNERDDPAGSGWGGAATWVGAGVAAAVVGGLGYYLFASGSNKNAENTPETHSAPLEQARRSSDSSTSSSETNTNNRMSDYLQNMFQRLETSSNSRRGIPRSAIPRNPVLNNLNALLNDIYVRYIALNDEDFELHYEVFCEIFYNNIHKSMKEVDPYYRKYSSTVQFAGSHFDRLRINKPDEFDMDIVIGLPLNIRHDPLNVESSDIVLEGQGAGFIQLKMGAQFQNLPMRDDWENNKAAYKWKETDGNYLLRSKFIDWFKSVVSRALDKYTTCGSLPVIYVRGVPYTIRKSESGPAMTLFIENKSRGFKLDVDLVPALKFPENRWPITKAYRSIKPAWSQDYWMVVPKPNKNGNPYDEIRSWRIALHNQERMLMHNSNHMRQAIRLMKKLRDSMGMKKIASYYIKTLFLWEAVERNDNRFWWDNNPATLFKIMVKKLHDALVAGNIPYFWNKSNNLIGGADRGTLNGYAAKLAKLIVILDQPSQYKQVAKFLLTDAEFQEYNTMFLHI